MTSSFDKAPSRPTRHEHGPYTVVSTVDQELESSSTVDQSEFPGESHPAFQSTETLKTKLDSELGVAGVAATVAPILTTGYAVKHGDIEGQSGLL